MTNKKKYSFYDLFGNTKDNSNSKYKQISNYYIDRAEDYRTLLGLDLNGHPMISADNETDAFRHAFLMASLARKYGNFTANIIGDMYEYSNNNPDTAEAKEMDLWNNRVGREIGLKVADELKGYENTFSDEHIEDMTAIKIYNALKNGEMITNTDDKRVYQGSVSKNVIRDLQSYANTKNELLNKPQDSDTFLDGLKSYISSEKEKLDSLKRTESPAHGLKEMLSSQKKKLIEQQESLLNRGKKTDNSRQENIDSTDSKDSNSKVNEDDKVFDENADISEYKNEVTGDSKIYTAEDIDNMSDDEYDENLEAINYQRKTIGIPTREQADKAVEKGGMVYVRGYTRSDGTGVKSYYRARPFSI